MLFLYKVINNSCPVRLPSYLAFFSGSRLKNSHLDDRCLVSTILPTNSTSSSYSHLFSKKFFLCSYCLWNRVPYSIRQLNSFSKFKEKLAEYVWHLARDHFVENFHDDSFLESSSVFDDGG